MRKLLLAGVGLLSCTAVAQLAAAADMEVWPLNKITPHARDQTYTSVHNWTGFYIGLNFGGGWGRASDAYTTPADLAFATSETFAGGLAGGQLGFNWQAGNLVLGLEADVDGSGQSGTGALAIAGCGAACPGTLISTERVSVFGTARGRLGFAVSRWMVYGTGGLSWQSVANSSSFTSKGGTIAGIGSNSSIRAGYVAGAGVETVLGGNWTGGVEYLYLDTGRFDTNVTTIPAPGIGPFPALSVVTDSTRLQSNILRARLEYRF
jgi:outer membrane immunogenic protein